MERRNKHSPKTEVFKPILINAAASKAPVNEACASFLCVDMAGGCGLWLGYCLTVLFGCVYD
jgi:hypothetical protein